MNEFEIVAKKRDVMGKGASRRLRRVGLVPGVVYGTGKEPVSITVEQKEMFKHLSNEAFFSHILSLNLDGKAEKVVLKDLQRHPYKQILLHLDLLRVDMAEKITMHIPLHFLNEETCPGVKQGGGSVSHMMTELDIICLPADLPEYIEVDVKDLNIGDAIHLGDLTLPEGVESAALAHGGDPSVPIVSVQAARIMSDDEDETEAGDEGGDAEAAGDADAE